MRTRRNHPALEFTATVTAQDEGEAAATGEDEPRGSLWEGVLAVEGRTTGDGRLFDRGAIHWGELPLPLRWAREDFGEHQGAVVIGRVLEVWRDGDMIRGRGDIDLASEVGAEALRMMRGDLVNGVSVDLDDVDVEIRVDREAFEEGLPAEDEPRLDEDGREIMVGFQSDEEIMAVVDGRLRAATLVDIPAFNEARLEVVSDEQLVAHLAALANRGETFQFPCPKPFDSHEECVAHMEGEVDDPDAFCAEWERVCSGSLGLLAGGTMSPPREWFNDPELDQPTGITVTDEGRIFGHLATWGQCHTAFSDCVTPPQSPSGYRWFHTGAIRTADGDEVAVGRVTMDTLHAGRRLGPGDTLAHYEHTGAAVADVCAGEDQHGVWIAGAVRPGVTDEQVAKLRGSPLSGDWRRIGDSMELVAALAVNVPGFPIPRTRALVSSGAVQAIQSAGIVAPSDGRDLSDSDRAVLRRLAQRERRAEQARQQRVKAARARVLVASAHRKVHGGR